MTAHDNPTADVTDAIDRALRAAHLRAGGANETSTAVQLPPPEPSGAETGDALGGADSD